MRAMRRIRQYVKVFTRMRRNRADLFGWWLRRPQVGFGTATYELMLILSNRLEPRLKELAELKVAGMVECEYCLDIGSALANSAGLTERQITELPRFRTSDAYTDLEKLVLAYTEAVTATPAVGVPELREQLLTQLSKAQLAELAAAIAWENQRARINIALGVRPTGMAEGMACALPERRANQT
ncbi:carboxymuconolactone decarboxylase family protein [Nocardia sp. NPDC051570]|uniref:carboxymuconolactone decarboxylase family protein n=1 Tax=Nocardia sp. NPDC051570 TaxID=3364324 RepID=UPI0037A97BB2